MAADHTSHPAVYWNACYFSYGGEMILAFTIIAVIAACTQCFCAGYFVRKSFEQQESNEKIIKLLESIDNNVSELNGWVEARK